MNDCESSEPAAPEPSGARLVRRIAVAGVVVHLLATLATFSTTPGVANAGVIVLVVLFGLGTVLFFGAFLAAAARSRDDAVWFGGVFLLNGGVVPAGPRRLLYGTLTAHIVIGVAAASIRPFTGTAFSILAIVLGFGLMALYGARFGSFPSQPTPG